MPKPGWSERQFEKAKREVQEWPAWMRPNLTCQQAASHNAQQEPKTRQANTEKDKKRTV